MTTPQETEVRLIALSFANPHLGCVRLSSELRQEGISLSPPTVQKLLVRHGRGSARDRWLQLEEETRGQPESLQPEQLAWVQHWNPAFRERGRETSRPGELLVQDVRAATPAERIQIHVAVDTYGGLAFGLLRTARDSADAIELMRSQVLPYYARAGLRITALLTPDSRLFWGSPKHPFERFLADAKIEHRSVHRDPPRRNGFLERLWRDVQEEFVAPRRAEWITAPVSRWQEEFSAWLEDYREVRPYVGYRNWGVPPAAFVGRGVHREA